jgi:hypothetical protein
MNFSLTLMLAGCLALGTECITRIDPAAAAKEAIVVTAGDASITIAPESKLSVVPMKREDGYRVQLTTGNVRIRSPRLLMESSGVFYEITVTPDGGLHVRQSANRP